MLPLKGIIFLLLNLIRLLSIISLILVFAAVISLIVQDSKAYSALQKAGDLQSYIDEYCYYPDSEVPTSTWGLFWLQLDRFIILCITMLGVASEVCFGLLTRFFNFFLPILGPSFSTAPLGVIQMMTSASLLSHYQEGFALGTSWLLFFVGLINFLVGIAFRSRLKLRRSLFRSKRLQSEKRDIEAVGGIDTAKSALWKLANTSIDRAVKTSSRGGSVIAKDSMRRRKRESLLKPSIKSIRTPLDAFDQPGTASQRGNLINASSLARTATNLSTTSEMLRKRARQENWRIEKEGEGMDRGQGASSVPLDRDFQWDPMREIPFPKPDLNTKPASLAAQIKRAQAGASRDLSNVIPREPGVRAAFQRRSLVLSKMVQQVKRGSTGSKKKKRISRIPPLPNLYAKKLIPLEHPSPWIEVKKSPAPPHMPSPIYRPDGSTVYEDLGNDSTRTRYHSFNTPISDQYAYHAR